MRWVQVILFVCGILVATDRGSFAEDWPTRSVKIVVPYAAGGTPDLLARALAQKLSDQFGASFYVENRTGANGNLGVDYVAKSAPDGYTLLLAADYQFSVNPFLESNLSYAAKDFASISLVADWNYVLAATPSLEANNIRELVALAKRRGPGKINYGSSGSGSTQELAMERLEQLGGFKLTEIPYRGTGQAAPDLIAGRTQLMFAGIAGYLSYLRSGQLKALGVTSRERVASMPDVPTIAEQGFSDYEANVAMGLFAPIGTAKNIIAELQLNTARALSAPDLRDRLLTISLNPIAGTPEELDARVQKNSTAWAQVLRGMRDSEQQ
jgi:tripartite-type tricarboxylate transporter receptor subunit TctC